MTIARWRTLAVAGASILVVSVQFPHRLRAQTPPAPQTHPMSDSMQMSAMADDAMGGMPADANMMKHMLLTPARHATHDDTLRAEKVVAELESAIAKYRDTSAATAAGYKMFLPKVKTQRVFHFTKGSNGFKEAFRFDPTQPTSLLYERALGGGLRLVGAMYTMPRRASLDKLNQRIPLSIAHWHQHVDWCLPKLRDQARWRDSTNGAPVFGPESPIATKSACDAAGGRFYPHLLGWMVHVNVFKGSDLGAIFADDHGGR